MPKDGEEILSGYAAPNGVDRAVPSVVQPNTTTSPLSIVLYVLCNNLLQTTDTSSYGSGKAAFSPAMGTSTNPDSSSVGNNVECFKVMKAFSEMMKEEQVPLFIRERVVLQVCSTIICDWGGASGKAWSLTLYTI